MTKIRRIVGLLMDFGSRLRDLRRAAGLTQKQLGLLVGTSQANIARYEGEKYLPGGALMVKLADALEVTLDEIVGRQVDGRPDPIYAARQVGYWEGLRAARDAIECLAAQPGSG